MSDLFSILILVVAFGALVGAIAWLAALMPKQDEPLQEPSTQKERS